jgi:hypothetical protein
MSHEPPPEPPARPKEILPFEPPAPPPVALIELKLELFPLFPGKISCAAPPAPTVTVIAVPDETAKPVAVL